MARVGARWAMMSLVAAFALSGCGAARAPFVTPATARPFFVAGYYPYWAGEHWDAYPHDLVDELYFFELQVGADGGFLDRHGWPAEWAPMVRDALASGVQVTPTVSMHDPLAFQELFGDARAVDRLVEGILGLFAEMPGLAGIHVDFEVFQPIDLSARDGYTAFVARLANRLERVDPALSVSVFTLAFDDDDAYNERALAEIADYLVLQGYDYHESGSANAGPLSAVEGWGRLNWTWVVDRFDAMGIAPDRIVMAVPMYGYEWPVEREDAGAAAVGAGIAIPFTAPPDVLPELPRARRQADLHGLRRDPASGSPYYVFRDGPSWRQGWFEDAASLAAKYAFVRRRGLAGVAIFPMPYADEALWNELRRALGGR